MDIGERKYSVYEHIFPNGMRYIGITSMKPERRWNQGKAYKASKMVEAISEYGWDNIEHNILETDLSKDEAKQRERELISYYKENGGVYNVGKGGDLGCIPSAEFEIDGIIYSAEELKKLAAYNNIDAHDLTTRINHHGWSIEKALSQEKIRKNQKFELDGKYYSAKELSEMAEDKAITPEKILSRINHFGWDVKRAITQPVGEKIQKYIHEYNGEMYTPTQLLKFSNVEGLTVEDIRNRIEYLGWSVEDALTRPKTPSKLMINYNGNDYTIKELFELRKDKSLSLNTIRGRINDGWDIDDVINMPKGARR